MKRVKKLKRIIASLAFLFILTLSLIGWSTRTESEEDLFKYKNAYTGDNSAVINTLNQLQYGDKLHEIKLKTDESPYGIIVDYEDFNSTSEEIAAATMSNATYMFALIQNVDWITFNFANEKITIERQALEDLYHTDLSQLNNQEDIIQLLEKHQNNQKTVYQDSTN